MSARKLGCSQPALGERLTRLLGVLGRLPPELDAHLARCAACRLERLELETLDRGAAPAPPGVAERLRATVIEAVKR